MKVAVIEDEKLAQREIIELLKQVVPGIEILTCLTSVAESVAWLRDQPEVDLLLMDIALSDGQSFEIFEQVSVDTPVIFLTAYDEYALRAFRVNSIDYLLKPVEESELRRALDKYRKMGRPQLTLSLDDIRAITKVDRPVYKERFIVRVGDVYRHISTEEVAYFYADEKVVWLVTHKKNKYILDHTLNELETLLDTRRFFR
ncbi:MAG: LytTR family DNA-binding domain-containing protein, partial [Bacteroidota bacterium]